MDVPIRCVCPPKADGSPRHEGDTITLRDTLGFVATQTARNAVHLLRSTAREAGEDNLDAAMVLAVLTEQYVLLGVEAWTLADEKGKAVPVNRATIRAFLDDPEADDVVSLVADEADGLYAGKVMLPLLKAASNSSPRTPTASTSPTPGSGKGPGKPSRPSSISTIPTAGTARTSKSRGGDSSSSRSSASVA